MRLYKVYYISANCYTCFGWYLHPSSGAHVNSNYSIWSWSNRICFLPNSNFSTSAEVRMRLKCDGTRAKTTFRLSAKRTSPFKSGGGVSSVDHRLASGAHQPAWFVLLVQARVLQSCHTYWLPTHFLLPLHFPSRASPCAITFQLDSSKYGSFSARCCNYSLHVLPMMDEGITRNM